MSASPAAFAERLALALALRDAIATACAPA